MFVFLNIPILFLLRLILNLSYRKMCVFFKTLGGGQHIMERGPGPKNFGNCCSALYHKQRGYQSVPIHKIKHLKLKKEQKT